MSRQAVAPLVRRYFQCKPLVLPNLTTCHLKWHLACCLVHLDAGSTTCLAQQNLQIPEHANNRTIPSWLFDARLSARDRLTSRRPDAILVSPLPTKHKLNTKRLSLLICTRCHLQDNTAEMYTEFRSSMSARGRHTLLRLNTMKIHDLDTN